MKKLIFIGALAAAVLFTFTGCMEDTEHTTFHAKNWNTASGANITVQFKSENGKSDSTTLSPKQQTVFSVDEYVSSYATLEVYAKDTYAGDVYYYWEDGKCYLWSNNSSAGVESDISSHSHLTAKKL